MISKQILSDVVSFCSCYADGESDVNIPCTYAPECVYKAECDEIRYTYGCKPFDLEQNIERGNTDNDTNDD